MDHRAREPVKEVPAEAALSDRNLEIPVRGAHYPHVHAQLEGFARRALYDRFVALLRTGVAAALAADAARAGDGDPPEGGGAAGAAIPPRLLFRCGEWAGKFTAFDARGVPTQDAHGYQISKPMRKKLDQIFEQHAVRQRAAQRGRASAARVPAGTPGNRGTPPGWASRAAARCVIAGSYGAKQGLRLDASHGPMARILDF